MRGSKRLRRLGGEAAALVGGLFFFIIAGVFGVRFAIAGLVGALSALLLLFRRCSLDCYYGGPGNVEHAALPP